MKKIKKNASRVTSILLILFGHLVTSQQLNTAKLDKKMQELLEVSSAPGFAVVIVKGNKILYNKGFGYSNIEKKEKVDAHTIFAIGSTSKAFTTSLLGIMEAEKGLKFDESPRKYLPSLEFYNDKLNNSLTIKDLVAHRSGLPRHDISWYLFPTENKDSLLSRIKYHEPFTDIRTTWYYNNFGYLIQGMITAQLTGKSWEQNIRDYFFGPLEMSRSSLSISEMKKFDNIATGYQWKKLQSVEPMEYFNIAAISPAGSINSSTTDMSGWLKTWLNKGKFNGKQVLPEAYITKAINPLMLVGGGISDPDFPDQHLKSYGYAWFTSSYKGHYRLEHGGNIDGFTANVSLFPTDQLGIAVLCNQDSSLLPSLARNIITDFVLELEKSDWISYHNKTIQQLKEKLSAQKDKENSVKKTGKPATHSLKDYTGNYHHNGYGTFKVYQEKDSLYAQFPARRYYLQHIHYNTFTPYQVKNNKVDLEDEMGVNFNFTINEIGEIEAAQIKFEPTLEALKFERSPDHKDVSSETLARYAGNYILKGVTLKVTYLSKNTLLLDVPGQPQYTLLPSSDSEFIIKGLTGYKAKFTDYKGVPELVLMQPNGVFTAQKQEEK